jgi:hypothetical protein
MKRCSKKGNGRRTRPIYGYTTVVTPHVEIMAHHYLLLAAPAFLPAVIVVAVILYIALRDRRERRNTTGAPTDASRPDTPDKKRD